MSALDKIKAALDAAHAATTTYAAWKRNVAAGKYVNGGANTRWGTFDRLMAEAQAELAAEPAKTLIDGGGARDYGVSVGAFDSPPAEQGREIAGLDIRNMRKAGVEYIAWDNGRTPPVAESVGRYGVHDINVENVGTGRTQNGTAEAGLQIGHTTDLARVRVRDCDWMGVETWGDCSHSVFEDLDVDVTMNPDAVGLYIEHVTRFLRVLGGSIRADGNAVNVEWSYRDPSYAAWMPDAVKAAHPGVAGSHDLHIGGTADKPLHLHSENGWCIWASSGPFNLTFEHLVLTGKNGIAYPTPEQRMDPQGFVSIDWSTIDTSGLTGRREWAVGADYPMGT